MQEKKESGNSDKFSISKSIVALVALGFAIISIATFLVEYLSLICALIAVIMGVVVIVKKLDGKVIAYIAILLGFVGAFLGGRTTYSAISAMLELGPEVVYSDDCSGIENCIEKEYEQDNNSEKLKAAAEKMEACLVENGIDPEIDFDDLADSEQETYTTCVDLNS